MEKVVKKVNFIFDDVADIINEFSVEEIRNKTGLKKGRIYNLRNGCTFYLDYNLYFAFKKLGYEIKIEKVKKK